MENFRLKSLSFFIIAVLIIMPIASVPVTSALAMLPLTSSVPDHIGELLQNGTFGSGPASPWFANGASLVVSEGRLEASITSGTGNAWDNVVKQTGIPVFDTTGTAGTQYQLTVKAWASADMDITAVLEQNGAPYTHYYTSTPLHLTSTPTTFTINFDSTAEDSAAVLQFWMGGQGNNTVNLDNISLNGPEPISHMQIDDRMIFNGDFTNGTKWWGGSNVTMNVSNAELAATITDGGTQASDANIGQENIVLLKDITYTLKFTAWASEDKTVKRLLRSTTKPYHNYFPASDVMLTTSEQTFSYTFTPSQADFSALLQLQLGNNGAFTFHLKDISLSGPAPTPATEFRLLRANQIGYLPNTSKIATLATEVTSPLAWTLYNNAHNPVASGMSTPFAAKDAASGEYVHTIDFSTFNTTGSGYTLEAYGETSHPFDIGPNIYDNLKYDALAYFYQSRAGIAIEMPYTGRADLAHPAGHDSISPTITSTSVSPTSTSVVSPTPSITPSPTSVGASPNKGDKQVQCFVGKDKQHLQFNGCNYKLDVAHGWYDAGDYGKYVPSGAIATWTLLNEYERAKTLGGNIAAFADGTMNIPENANGVPDILDEARWEIEFMLSMQVPAGGIVEGEDMSGMVHHKLHGAAWTAFGVSADQDPEMRYLYPPSTAATLDMAAVAAQCARIWESIDSEFSDRCLTASKAAWTAAIAHPAKYAADNFIGGGPYNDTNVSDEFSWAASELYISTHGDSAYSNYIVLSIPATNPLTKPSGEVRVSWHTVQPLGAISLVVAPNSPLTSAQVETVWASITTTADEYLNPMTTQGYTLPYNYSSDYQSEHPTGYAFGWASNADILNNLLILGLAYDHTKQTQYLRGVTLGMDYLLGHNPNDKSYVSGYGANPLTNPQHRFWAPSLGAFPLLPPGIIANGPDQKVEDPYIQKVFPTGCDAFPQKCYVDLLQSYSTNEVAVNLNAPLAWVAAFLDDIGDQISVSTPTPTATATVTATSIATATKTATATSTATATKTFTATSTVTATATKTFTATSTATATATKTFTATSTSTPTSTVTPTATKTPVTVTFTSVAAQDGWVLESTQSSSSGGSLDSTASTFRLGDDSSKKQYRSILSFTTSSIPDTATITSVILQVKKQGIAGGGNPVTIFQGFIADIKKGIFGTASLQITDFQTSTTGTVSPASSSLIGSLYSINLTSGNAFINKLSSNNGLTQIRLRFKLADNNNTIANYLSLFSGNAGAADSPKLVITYTLP